MRKDRIRGAQGQNSNMTAEEKHRKVAKELNEALELSESIPILELTDCIRKNGFFFRLDKPEFFMEQFEELLKNVKNNKNKTGGDSKSKNGGRDSVTDSLKKSLTDKLFQSK